jgi:hypothetical protein
MNIDENYELKEKANKLKSLIKEANNIIEDLTNNCLYITVKQPTGKFLKIDILKSF